MAEENYQLSSDQIDHFLEHGWVKLSNCFSKEQAAKLQETLWTRLGMDPNDTSTWYVFLSFELYGTLVLLHAMCKHHSAIYPRSAFK
jgi:hypothetical protein